MVYSGDHRGADFSGRQLDGAVFENADLYRANFTGAHLEGAHFQNCFAAEAQFVQADCKRLMAVKSNFYRADFRGATLSDSLWWNCVLSGADLRGAELRRVTLTLDCNSFEETRLSRTTSAELAYLFSRSRSPHREGWLSLIGERDLTLLDRVFRR